MPFHSVRAIPLAALLLCVSATQTRAQDAAQAAAPMTIEAPTSDRVLLTAGRSTVLSTDFDITRG